VEEKGSGWQQPIGIPGKEARKERPKNISIGQFYSESVMIRLTDIGLIPGSVYGCVKLKTDFEIRSFILHYFLAPFYIYKINGSRPFAKVDIGIIRLVTFHPHNQAHTWRVLDS
jgi:hypothetical protein